VKTELRLLATATTGRYLLEPAESPGAPLLVGFHGYAQRAEQLLEELRALPGAGAWTRVAVQALHRFYRPKDQEVVGSWMTSLDRDSAIADNLAYVQRVLAELRAEGRNGPLVFAGFSQGAAMAWRAAAGCRPCQGLLVLGGDLPADVARSEGLALPPVLLGRGADDRYYTAPQLERDLASLEGLGAAVEVVRFPGGHEWAPGFQAAAGRFLERVRLSPAPRPGG
jgi:predicted esterase